jgi:hypothetical protein
MESSKKVSMPGFAKVVFGSPSHSIDRTPDMSFRAVFAFA